jgi:hypothetical protein
MKAFFVGLLVLVLIMILSVVLILLIPFLMVLGLLLRLLLGFILILFAVWFVGKVTLLVIEYLRNKEREAPPGKSISGPDTKDKAGFNIP